MQTLYTIEDRETGGIKTYLHVSNETNFGLAVIIFVSDEYGNHKATKKRTFLDKKDAIYHEELRKKVKHDGGIIHTRVSDTPLPRSIQKESNYPGRDNRGKFIKKK